MKREWWLASAMTLLTLAAALAILRHFAPGLLGVPTDLQLVQLDEAQPAFYAGVFRPEDYRSPEFMLKDPITGVRARPLFENQVLVGPHDILGLRNAGVPRVADIIAIGDSQTYGVNAAIVDTWPQQLQRGLQATGRSASGYMMALGGWSAPQYLHMAQIAAVFQPRVLVVAFYAGNDPIESFMLAYGSPQWSELRPDTALSASDAPALVMPIPDDQRWTAELAGGRRIEYALELRRLNVRADPAADAGWRIMKRVAGEIAGRADAGGWHLVLTLLPTKERVHAPMLAAAGAAAPEEFLLQVGEEQARHEDFAAYAGSLPATTFVDVVPALQQAAAGGAPIYPDSVDGHPTAPGYALIAAELGNAVAPHLSPQPCGAFVFVSRSGGEYYTLADGRGRYWHLDPQAWERVRGDPQRRLWDRDLATLELQPGDPPVDVDPARCPAH